MSSGERRLLLVGGCVYPTPTHQPVGAVLVESGRVVAVGDEAELRSRIDGPVEVIDLDGATVTAGFTDAHIHPTAWALARRRVSLVGTRSPEEAAGTVARSASVVGGVIRGHGWNGGSWPRSPTRTDLDRYLPDTPVFLDSQDLHSAWLNGAALRLCGIDDGTPDPAAGTIVRDASTGEPTGLLLEAARAMALDRLPVPGPNEIRAALLDAQTELHGYGITAVHSVEPTGLRDVLLLEEDRLLELRVLQHIQLDQLGAARELGLRGGFGGDRIRIGGVKMFLDGSLGSRTAWLRAPYEDTADDFGTMVIPPEDFRAAVEAASAAGLSSTVHAIGDAAVELALRVLARVAPAIIPHRIEHVQLCPEDLWELAGSSGIVGSIQPVHLLTDIPVAERYWGRRRSAGAYPLAALERAGMVLAFGSDAPVETPDPRPGLVAAVQRGTWSDWREGRADRSWFPEHRLSGRSAVAAYTTGAARAAGWGGRRGAVLPGYDADLVAWSMDPLNIDPSGYRSMECVLTMVGGEVVYRKV